MKKLFMIVLVLMGAINIQASFLRTAVKCGAIGTYGVLMYPSMELLTQLPGSIVIHGPVSEERLKAAKSLENDLNRYHRFVTFGEAQTGIAPCLLLAPFAYTAVVARQCIRNFRG